MSFYIRTNGPQSWQALLGDPVKHWKVGRSARTLAHCWEAAAGLPPEVAEALDASGIPALAQLTFIAGFPEHEVPLPGGRRASQTDVFVIARGDMGLVSMAIEGKVDEPFGPTVSEWLSGDPSVGRLARLAYLTKLLGCEDQEIGHLRYQLLHRTASAIIEAERLGAPTSAMLVHTWAGANEGRDDFEAFVLAMGGSPHDNPVIGVINRPGLYFGWIQGDPQWLNA